MAIFKNASSDGTTQKPGEAFNLCPEKSGDLGRKATLTFRKISFSESHPLFKTMPGKERKKSPALFPGLFKVDLWPSIILHNPVLIFQSVVYVPG